MGVIDHGTVFVSKDSGDTYLPIPDGDLPDGSVTIMNQDNIKKNGLINIVYDYSRGGFLWYGHSNRKFKISPRQLITKGQQVVNFYFSGDGIIPQLFANTHQLTIVLIDGETEVVPKLDVVSTSEPPVEQTFFMQAFAALDLQLTCSMQEALQSSVRAVRPSTGLLPSWICLAGRLLVGGSSEVKFAEGYFNAVRTVGFMLRQAYATNSVSLECLQGLAESAKAVASRRERDCEVLAKYGSTTIQNHRAAVEHWSNLTRYLLHGIATEEQKLAGETRIFL